MTPTFDRREEMTTSDKMVQLFLKEMLKGEEYSFSFDNVKVCFTCNEVKGDAKKPAGIKLVMKSPRLEVFSGSIELSKDDMIEHPKTKTHVTYDKASGVMTWETAFRSKFGSLPYYFNADKVPSVQSHENAPFSLVNVEVKEEGLFFNKNLIVPKRFIARFFAKNENIQSIIGEKPRL